MIRPFTWYHNFLPGDIDLLLKNFNLRCFLVMVAARRASLSSDNSYSLPSQISWAVHKGHTLCGKLALQSIRKDNVPHAAVFPFTVMPSVLYVVLHVFFSELLFINSLLSYLFYCKLTCIS